MILRLSRDAGTDLQDIADYTLITWGEEQETLYLKQIYARLQEVGEQRGRFGVRHELFEGCQVAPIGRHLIFFLIKDDTTIVVSRILHQSMDFPRHFFPDW